MTIKNSIRLMIVDDHPVTRFGLRGILEDQADIELVGEASTGRQAVTLYAAVLPDIVTMDNRMGDMQGSEIARQMRTIDPEARILFLSAYETEQDIRDAVMSGAKGFVHKEAEAEDLVAAIRTVAAGGTHFPVHIQRLIERGLEASAPTSRERQLLMLLAKGMNGREIGEQLKLTEGTVRVYLTRLYEKLGAAGRAEAIAIAHSRGLLRNE